MRVYRFLVLAIVTLGGVLLAPAVASAHDLRVDVTVTNEVKVLAYFDDDTPAENATAFLIDAEGYEVLTGKTDDRGVWVFPKPAPGQYTLKVKSIGHVGKVEFRVEGQPEEAVVYTDWRLSKPLALAIGVGGLLGISAIAWLLLRRKSARNRAENASW